MCPICQGKARRVINSVPVIFKGSGFYVTDNRKSNATEKGEEELPDKVKGKEKGD
jgi:predicted nucleic acid-binding Zn ribbon protein